jgi:hypothetical protein
MVNKRDAENAEEGEKEFDGENSEEARRSLDGRRAEKWEIIIMHLLGLSPAGYLAAPDNGP